jgi:hypothetical protein
MRRVASEETEISAPIAEVWQTITDVTRMGEWSPECTATRWVNGADHAKVGAEFEGDNVVRLGGRTVKRWTTVSEIVECKEPSVFAFVADGYTQWTFKLERVLANCTRVTETFSYVPKGVAGHIYDRLLGRPRTMALGMRRTLTALKLAIEQDPASEPRLLR